VNTTPLAVYRQVLAESYYSSQRRLPGWLPDLPHAAAEQGETLTVIARVIVMDKRSQGVLVCTAADGECNVGSARFVENANAPLIQAIRETAAQMVTQGLHECYAPQARELYTDPATSVLQVPQYRLSEHQHDCKGKVLSVAVLLKVDKEKIQHRLGVPETIWSTADWKSVAWLKSVADSPSDKFKLSPAAAVIVNSNMIASLNASLHQAAVTKF
jgi:hypothetical protein